MTYVGSVVGVLGCGVVVSVIDGRVGIWRGGEGEREDLDGSCSGCSGGMSCMVRRSVLPNPPCPRSVEARVVTVAMDGRGLEVKTNCAMLVLSLRVIGWVELLCMMTHTSPR